MTAATSGPCVWLSEAEASSILHQRMVYRKAANPQGCEMGPWGASTGIEPAGNLSLLLEFQVDDNVASYMQYVNEDSTILSGLADRAVWNPKSGDIVVIKGGKRVVVRLLDLKEPSALTESDRQEKSVAVAEKIISKM